MIGFLQVFADAKPLVMTEHDLQCLYYSYSPKNTIFEPYIGNIRLVVIIACMFAIISGILMLTRKHGRRRKMAMFPAAIVLVAVALLLSLRQNDCGFIPLIDHHWPVLFLGSGLILIVAGVSLSLELLAIFRKK
jgi:uncharacterized membrane protein YkvI